MARGRFKSLSVSETTYNKLREIAERRGFSTLADTVAYLVSLEELVARKLESITASTGNITRTSGNVTTSSGNVSRAPTTGKSEVTKAGEKKRVIVFSLEWAKQKGINVEDYMARREKEGYLCNDTGRMVYCIWREDIEQLIVDLNNSGAKMNELEKTLSGDRLEIARTAVEAGLMWYDNKERRWRAPL
jgi:hypothetical protein